MIPVTQSTLHLFLIPLDSSISALASSAVDHLATFIFVQRKKKKPSESFSKVQAHMQSSMDLVTRLLAALFNLVLFENVGNLWSFSRPLLSLTLINEAGFANYRNEVLAIQPPQNRDHVSEGFKSLMEDVRPSLENKNRDKFTQQLVYFVNDIKKCIVRPPDFV